MENFPLSSENVEHSVFNKAQYKGSRWKFILGLIGFLIFFNFLFLSAPGDFPVGTTLRLEPGMTLRSISLKLKNEHFIRSRLAFEALVIIFGGEKHAVATDYYFENKLPVYELARRVAKGERYLAPVSVTIPEGFNLEQIGDVFSLKLANFDKADFLLQAKGLEGYLFPDTYFFLTTSDEKEVIESMSRNFEKKIKPLLPEIVSSGQTEKDVIIMASIIEREAKGDADRGVIAGILWKRISAGMSLQVDAAPETYKRKGLPPAPLGNPGLLAIQAAIHPQRSPYLYYLHDRDGHIHYAKNFAEHTKNKLKYLK